MSERVSRSAGSSDIDAAGGSAGERGSVAAPQHRSRLATIQELLESQRKTAARRCAQCGRDGAERDHELVEAALRARIRMLEARLGELGVHLANHA